jgi:hypothetical protein
MTGGCGSVNATGTITVTANNTAGSPSSTPTLCINTALTSITITTTGATGISNSGVSGANGLPAGVSATWASNTITISGTPTASGTFNYSIPMTGGCGSVNATGTITVTANNTAGSPSSTPTLCINTALTSITITTTGATSISNSGVSGANGLPAGVSATWASNTITISGTPTASGTFNYRIPMTGGCGSVNATGTITVTANNTAGSPSSTPTLCINTALTSITITTTGATGISNSGVSGANGLPAGVSATWASNTITISGTPTTTVGSPFSYSIPLTGGCGSVNATGTITVTPPSVAGSISTVNPSNVCNGSTFQLILTGNTGSIQWQQSFDNSTWSTVSGGSGGTTTTYTTAPLSSGLYYQAVVTSGSCASATTSSSALVTVDESNSAASTYNSSWANNQNDNTNGLDAWALSNSGSAGFFASVSSSEIDTSGDAWGMFANSGGNAIAVRPFTTALSVGNTVSFSMDNGNIQSGGSVGFILRNSTPADLLKFSFTGGDSFYKIIDNSGTITTGIGFTNTGLRFTVTFQGTPF